MTDLANFLATGDTTGDATGVPLHHSASKTIMALASAAADITWMIREPATSADFGKVQGSANADGDDQKALDVICDERVAAALKDAGVAIYLSEEQEGPLPLTDDGLVIVACDPLDGSSNIETNISIGTIFSILPAAGGILQPGRNQLASGFFVYGPQTTLLLTMGQGVAAFQMDASGVFQQLDWDVKIAPSASEFAINMSYSRHWHAPISRYIDDCLAGSTGPRKTNFNMRWVGSLVADGWRIFRRGGVFLYPADSREAYLEGRLRLVYEAAPVAFLVEQAGGVATTGLGPIMDVVPERLHQRISLIFGSRDEVEEIKKYYS